MDLDHFDQLEEALKTDASILGIAFLVLLPLSYLHNLFFVIFTLCLVYLTGSGCIYLVSALVEDKDDSSS